MWFFSLQKLKRFITYSIWHLRLDNFPKWQRGAIVTLRICLLAIKDFTKKDLVLRASALTLFSLLSIVPVVAMIFGIAQGFGLAEFLDREISKLFANQPVVLENVLNYAHNLLSGAKGGVIAGFGFVLLLWSVLQVLGNIENAFNSIWYVEKPRTIIRKFTDYLSIMLVAPLFIIISGTATYYINTQIHHLLPQLAFLGSTVTNLIVISLKVLPFITTILLFYFIYQVIPNTRVKPKAAFIAAIIAGVVFQFFQWGYIVFQIGVSRNNAVYGSFASIPLFITWLQFSWIIILIGAEISYSMQNIAVFEAEIKTTGISHKMRMLYSLYIMQHVASKFKLALPPPDAIQLSTRLGIPINLCRQLLSTLQKASLVVQTTENEKSKEFCYVPAVDLQLLTFSYIINKLERFGEQKKHHHTTDLMHQIKVHYNALEDAMDHSASNKNILDV